MPGRFTPDKTAGHHGRFQLDDPLDGAGYAGRGVTCLAIAGLSLFAIWLGIDAKGLGFRAGMGVTGVFHGAMAGLAVAAALGLEGSDGGSPGYVSMFLGWPGGWILIGTAGGLHRRDGWL